MDSATWCRTPAAASAASRLRPEVSKNSSTALSSNEGELARSIASQGLLEPLAGNAVDTAFGRAGDDLVAALAQNGDGLRADQAGAAVDDDLHGLLSLVDDWRPLKRMQVRKKSGPQRACIKQTREETNNEASLRNTPLATERNPSKRGCRGICSLAKCSGGYEC